MSNQYFDSMKNFMNPEALSGFMKNIPVMDFSSFSNLVKKNAEVISATNQMTAESAQAILRRTSEVMQNSASEMVNMLKDVATASDLEQAAARQQQYIKSSFETSLGNSKEIMDMLTKSATEIFETFSKNLSDNFSEHLAKASSTKSSS